MDESGDPAVDWTDVAAASADGVGIVDGEEFVYADDRLAELFGYEDPAELVGDSWRSLVAATDRDRVEGMVLPAVREAGRWRGELDGQRAGRGTIRVDLSIRRTEGELLVWAVRGGDDSATTERRTDRTERRADRTELGPDRTDVAADDQSWSGRGAETRVVQNVVDALDDVLYVVDDEGRFTFWNEELCDRFGYDDEEVAELDPKAFLTEAESDELPPDPTEYVDIPDRHNVVDLVAKDGESITHELRGVTYADEVTGERYRVGIARDITDRLERERGLERQRNELATLDRITQLLFDIINELVETTSREAVQRIVCERLSDSGLYQFAWIGEREFDGDRIVPRASAGDDEGYLESVSIAATDAAAGSGSVTAGSEPVAAADDPVAGQNDPVTAGNDPAAPENDSVAPGSDPVAEAMRTGCVRAATVGADAAEPWEARALERGVRSVLAVPLRHDRTVHGVLAVYATRPDAFSEHEQQAFAVLGETVGFAINSIRRRELLFADSVTQLEFAVAGPDSVVTGISAALDCRLSLAGSIAVDDRWLLYLDVEDAAAADAADVATAHEFVERARPIADGAGRLELAVTGRSLFHELAALGVHARSFVVDGGSGHLTIDAPGDVSVHGIVDRIGRLFADAELVGQREYDRSPEPAELVAGPLGALTSRQREALEVAYRAGYFDWPRESTAEEVAEALGIAAPTLHGHLRKAQQALVSSAFE